MGKLQSIMEMTKLKVKANSPTICLVAGIVTSAAAIGLTVVAGIKTPSILEQRRNDIEDIEKSRDDENKEFEYTEEDAEHDIKRANGQCVFDLVKAYSPALGLWCLSIVLFVNGNRILEKRNMALATALNSTQAFLAGYRERVATYLGKEKEEEVYRGKYKKQEIDPETGELHEEELVDEKVNYIFKRIYDENVKAWKDFDWENQNQLFEIEHYLNNRLQERAMYNGIGVMTFNEVLSTIGFPECPEGFTLGWWYSDDHRSVINFGLEKDTRFFNGMSKEAHMTFNVDGDIIQVLKKNNIKELYRA